MRLPRSWFLLLLALAAPAVSAEPPSALAVQELEGRLADAEKRAAFEAGERERLTRTLEELRSRVSSLSEEAALQRRRGEDLDRRRGACEEREDALRAELDLCGRMRQRAEEQKVRYATELEGVETARRSEAVERDRVLEECRGRSATLEAQNLLLAAEKQGAERERQENVDETAHNYDDLISSLRRELTDCQARASELEGRVPSAELARLSQERARVASEEQTRRAGEASELLGRLRKALRGEVEKGRVALSASSSRVDVRMSLSGLYSEKTGEFSPALLKTMKGLSGALKPAGDRAVIVEYLSSGPSVFSNAARVAAVLQREAGLDPGKMIFSARSSQAQADPKGGVEVDLGIIPYGTFGDLFSPPALPSSK